MARPPSAIPRISMSSASKPPQPSGKMASHGYTELRSIGRGSFGEATLVQDRDGNRFVMKTVDIGNLDIEQQKDAVNEVKVLSSLKHPYIVRYHESFINEGVLAIVMDYAEGGDLAKRISLQSTTRELFDETQILRWLTQIVLGLKHLHQRHIIHRDMKPQNLFLTKKDDLRIGDFGISKRLGNKKAVVEQTMGTPYYLSPEICLERLYSFASDIWALGCILFQLTALKVPFEAQNVYSLIKKITSGQAPVVSQAFSAEMRQLTSSLLCQDHKRRPSAAEIVQGPMVQAEMRRMLGGLPGATPGVTPGPTPTPSPPVSALPSFREHPQSPRKGSVVMRPQSAFAGPSAMRPQSAFRRAPSPRSRLQQQGNNLVLTPTRENTFCSGKQGNNQKDVPPVPLLRAQSACGNRNGDDACGRKLRPPTPSHPPSARPRSAAPMPMRPHSAVPTGRSYAALGGG